MDESRPAPQRLGLFSATTIVIGSMIGSGIFIAPSVMAGYIQTPGILLGLWIFGGFFTLLGALSYGELAAMAPKAGGQYVFLSEAYSPFWGFLYGWTLFLVIQTGFNAAVSIAFAKYLGQLPGMEKLGEGTVLLDLHEYLKINSAQVVACFVILILTAINIRGLREGAFVQNLFTVLKVGALAVLIVGGLALVRGTASHFLPLWDTEVGPTAIKKEILFSAALAVTLSQALFAYDSWNSVTFVAEEVREPERTLPRALILGTLVATLIYVLTNVAYLANFSMKEIAEVKENLIAAKLAEHIFGISGRILLVIAVLISTFGCVNGLILSGARVCYAMARDGLFIRGCARLHPQSGVPVTALMYQGVWSCVLTLTGSYTALLTYTTFASVLFGALTVAGLIVLRYREPNRSRPYRCAAYPLTPILYLIIALPFLVDVIRGDAKSTGIGLILVLSGVPVYWWLRRTNRMDITAKPT